MDEGARRLERTALAGDREAAERFCLALARAGDLDIGRMNAARAASGLELIPAEAVRGTILCLLGIGESALVRVTWDELAIELGFGDQLVCFDGSSVNTPDWILDQAHDDAGAWIEYRGLEDKLTENQRQEVVNQFYYAIEAEWMPQRRITARLIERWITGPVNDLSTDGRRGMTREVPEPPSPTCHECGEDVVVNDDGTSNHLAANGDVNHDADADHVALPEQPGSPDRNIRIRGMLCQGQAISIESIDTRMDVSMEETGVTFRVYWPIWMAIYEAGFDDSIWRDRPLDIGSLTSQEILRLANEARHVREVRVELPEHDGGDYPGPTDEKLMEEIARAAPKKKPRATKKTTTKKKRGRKNMSSSNPSPESVAYDRDLKAGQITPAAIERRLRQLRDELDDAVFFKHSEREIASLREQVADMEAVLAGGWPHPEGDTARRERLEQEASARASSVEATQRKLDVAQREVSMLEADVREAVRMRDPEREVKKLRESLAKTVAMRDALRLERDAALSGLQAMAAKAEAEIAASAGGRTEQGPEPREQRRTFDGRLLDDESAAEIDRLLGMIRSGSLTYETVSGLMRNARQQYETGSRSGIEAVKLHAIAHKLMILDHVLRVGFKRSANRGRR